GERLPAAGDHQEVQLAVALGKQDDVGGDGGLRVLPGLGVDPGGGVGGHADLLVSRAFGAELLRYCGTASTCRQGSLTTFYRQGSLTIRATSTDGLKILCGRLHLG